MLQLLLLTLAGAGLAAMVSGGDEETSVDPDMSNNDEEDGAIVDDFVPEAFKTEEELGEVGATAIFDEERNVLTIDVGDDETGTIAAVRFDEEFGNCCSSTEEYLLYVYLVPEGANFPPSVEDVIASNPDLLDDGNATYTDFDGDVLLTFEAYLENAGGKLLGEIDLGQITQSSDETTGLSISAENSVNYDLELDANREIQTFSLFSDGEGNFISCLPHVDSFDETIVPFRGAATVTIVSEDGGSSIEEYAHYTTDNGAEGNDVITVQPLDADNFISGGAEIDRIGIGTSDEFADVGEGDDVSQPNGQDGTAQLESGEGTDSYIVDDFEPGTDQIVLELGDRIEENWTISLTYRYSPIGTNIHLSFPDSEDNEGFDFRVSGTNKLTIEDIVIVKGV